MRTHFSNHQTRARGYGQPRPDGTLADYGDEPITVDVARGKVSSERDTQPGRISCAYRNRPYVLRNKGISQLGSEPQQPRCAVLSAPTATPTFLKRISATWPWWSTTYSAAVWSRPWTPTSSGFYESYESLHPRIFGNTVELIVNEAGTSGALPASRLSDGTIRFIALLAIPVPPKPAAAHLHRGTGNCHAPGFSGLGG